MVSVGLGASDNDVKIKSNMRLRAPCSISDRGEADGVVSGFMGGKCKTTVMRAPRADHIMTGREFLRMKAVTSC